MHHDENVYPNPEEYTPERFLEADGKTPVMIPDTKELGQHAFGFGRRSCIGYSIAKYAAFIRLGIDYVLTIDTSEVMHWQ